MRRGWRGGATVAMALLVGCSGAGGEEAASPPPSPATTTETSGDFGELRDLPDAAAAVAEAGIEVPGTALAAASWDDANGQNLAVLSTSVEEGQDATTTRLFTTHHVFRDGGSRRLRDVNDVVEDCPLDTAAQFVTPDLALAEASAAFYNPRSDDPALVSEVRGPLEVTDVDGDQIGELTFAYSLGCRGDVSPLVFKLLVLEGGEKYILRGETWGAVTFAEQYGALDAPEAEPAQAEWPEALRRHAEGRYELYAIS